MHFTKSHLRLLLSHFQIAFNLSTFIAQRKSFAKENEESYISCKFLNARFGNILKDIKMLNDNPFYTQRHLSFTFLFSLCPTEVEFFSRSFSRLTRERTGGLKTDFLLVVLRCYEEVQKNSSRNERCDNRLYNLWA